MLSTLEITVERRVEGCWPVVVEDHRPGKLLPIRSEGVLKLAGEPSSVDARSYGTALGEALFRDSVRDAFVSAGRESPEGIRVLVFVEADELKGWRWEWLCAPVDSISWDFLSLNQRALFSIYLPSLTDRAYPPIGRRDLRVLVVVANPADPGKKFRLASFDVAQNVARLQSIFDQQVPVTVLARLPGAAGVPTMEELEKQLTAGTGEGPYTILHLVCHGWVDRKGETTLYLEQTAQDASSGQGLVEPILGEDLIRRLKRVPRLPYLVFLSACESAASEAEQRLGGLAQRLVRELGIPAVIGMTEKVTIPTAHALADALYHRLLAQQKEGEVDRALAEAYAGLASRPDVNVPALYSRLGAQPLFSEALDRPLTPAEIRSGLQQLQRLLNERAPVLQSTLAKMIQKLGSALDAEKVLPFEEFTQEVVEISFHALAQGEHPPDYDARQPFRGLAPFRKEDREFFFGREKLVEKLERKLGEDNFLPVLGPSGSGKSSLVLAGLAPRLQQKESALQVIDDLTPGSAPMAQLEARQAKLGSGPVLYIVDQFEELFTLCKDVKQRTAFIDELLKLSESNRVVLTMRADFWGECASYPALKDRMQARQELVPPMTTTELRGAMEQQAAKVGLRFEADLSNTMLDEVAEEPGAMPLLQHALLELWKRRHGKWLKTEEYRDLGGVKKAIAETADRLYGELSLAERERIRDIFLRLTQIDETVVRGEERRDTRRRVKLSDLVPAGSDAEETKALVKRLADAVLIVTSRNEVTGQDEVEVAHEALIRHWQRLRDWLDEDRTILGVRENIRRSAMEWMQHKAESGGEAFLIHRGGRLHDAESLLNNLHYPLNQMEQDYVNACVAMRDREQIEKEALQHQELEAAQKLAAERQKRLKESERLRRIGLARFRFAVALGAIAIVAAVAAWYAWMRAQQQTRIATARQLAAQSQATLQNYPQRSLLLALESVATAGRAGEVGMPVAEETLRQAVTEIGGRALWGHDGALTSMIITPDSHWLVTGGEDKTARLWDLTARDPGASHIVLRGHEATVTAVAVSPDSHWLVTGGEDKTARLWDLSAKDPGASHIVLRGHEATVTAVAVSSDSRWLVTRSYRLALLWDLKAKDPAASRIVLPGGRYVGLAVLFSPDSRWLVTGDEKTGRLWDLNAKDPGASQIVLPGHKDNITASAISSDSRWLVTVDGYATAFRWDLKAKDPVASRIVLQRGEQQSIRGVAISPDSHWLVIHGGNKAGLWDLTAKELRAPNILLQCDDQFVDAVAISPDSRWLVTGEWNGTVRIWDLAAKDPRASQIILRGHEDHVTAIAISTDSHWLVTGSADNTARLWDLKGRDPNDGVVVLQGHESPINTILISGDSRWLVTAAGLNVRDWLGLSRYRGNFGEAARLWDLKMKNPEAAALHLPERAAARTKVPARRPNLEEQIISAAQAGEISRHALFGMSVEVSSDCRWVVAGAEDGTARLWDLSSKDSVPEPSVLLGHTQRIRTVGISPDSHWLVTGDDKGGRLWDLTLKDPGASHIVLMGQEGLVWPRAFSPNSHWLVTGDEKTGRLWDLSAKDPGASQIVLLGNEDRLDVAAFSPDSRWLVTGNEKTGRLWDLTLKDPGASHIVLPGKEVRWEVVAFSPDSRWLLTGTGRLWDLTLKDPGASHIVLPGNEGRIEVAAFSPDSRWLVTGDDKGIVRIWNSTAKGPGALHTALRGHEGYIRRIAFSPNSRWLVTGDNKTARLWDLTLKDPGPSHIILWGQQGYTGLVAFSPNSRWLVAGEEDGTVRIWDLTAKDVAASYIALRGHDDSISKVVISADSRWLITVSSDGTARVWNLRLNEVVAAACRVAGRNLSKQEWKQYMGEQLYKKTCTMLPVHPSVFESARAKARSGETNSAADEFRNIARLEPSLGLNPDEEAKHIYADVLLDETTSLVESGKIREAIVDCEKAQSINPKADKLLVSWNSLCWHGALSGFARDVMPFCERAVSTAPSSNRYLYRDSRGVARALTGNVSGAIEDFRAFVEGAKADNIPKEYGQKREGWIKALEAGKNPFDEATLKALSNE